MKDKKGKIGFSYAIKGILRVAKSEWNFRFHIVAMIFVICAGLFFRLAGLEWVAIVIVIGMVFMAELFNSTIEKIIDYVKPQHHPAAAYIKDAAAGAVLISAMTAVVVGIIIFFPKIMLFF